MELQSIYQKKSNLPILIFVFFFLINISASGGHTDPYDGIITFLVSENFAINGLLSLNQDSPSAENLGIDLEKYIKFKAWNLGVAKYYEEFGTHDPIGDNMEGLVPDRIPWVTNYMNNIDTTNFYGPTYLVFPVIISPLYVIGDAIGAPIINFVSLFANSIIIALLSTMIFLISTKIFESEKIGFVLAIIFGVTSFMWPYITTI